jgi:hypothetical protein
MSLMDDMLTAARGAASAFAYTAGIILGIRSSHEREESSLINLKEIGFLELVSFGFTRPYPVIVQMADANTIGCMVAEAAYYRANRRGFAPGQELYDWLEAEQEILARFGELSAE